LGESVVADAGPLIAFGRIQRLELLPQVLGEVLVPHAVAVECLADPEKPGARAICDAFQAQLLTETPDNHLAALPTEESGVGKVELRTNFIHGGRREVLWHRPAQQQQHGGDCR
jgi:predicted nucleic acid-binding protein